MKLWIIATALIVVSCVVPTIPQASPLPTTETKPIATATPSTSHTNPKSETSAVTPKVEVPFVLQTNHALKYQTITRNGIRIDILTFDSSQYHLEVADQAPGAKWTSAHAAMTAENGIAAINGGFFGTTGTPLGLVRADNQSTGEWNSSSSLTSGVYQFSSGQSTLLRNRSANRQSSELLQTGPFLLENSQIVSGLSTDNPAQRSLLLWDGGTHFAIAQTSSCTLANLAKALKALPSTLPKKTALNLDGGRSCDLYISNSAHSTPVQRGHWLKSQVRNYLVLVKN